MRRGEACPEECRVMDYGGASNMPNPDQSGLRFAETNVCNRLIEKSRGAEPLVGMTASRKKW